jgi:hypothetical protein
MLSSDLQYEEERVFNPLMSSFIERLRDHAESCNLDVDDDFAKDLCYRITQYLVQPMTICDEVCFMSITNISQVPQSIRFETERECAESGPFINGNFDLPPPTTKGDNENKDER